MLAITPSLDEPVEGLGLGELNRGGGEGDLTVDGDVDGAGAVVDAGGDWTGNGVVFVSDGFAAVGLVVPNASSNANALLVVPPNASSNEIP